MARDAADPVQRLPETAACDSRRQLDSDGHRTVHARPLHKAEHQNVRGVI